MRWFKHLLGNNEGDSELLDALIDEFGHVGYYVFYRTLEVMGNELKLDRPDTLTMRPRSFYRKFKRCSSNKVKTIIQYCHDEGCFEVLEDKNVITIKCIKFKELADNYTDKAIHKIRTKYGQSTDTGTDNVQKKVSLDIDRDKDRDTNKQKTSKAALKEINDLAERKVFLEIEDTSKDLYESKIFKEVFAFKNTACKKKINPKATLHALVQCQKSKPKDPWAYCAAILKIEDGNYNAQDFMRGVK